MPKLPGFVGFFLIQRILEGGVALPQCGMELRLVAHTAKVEWITGCEDDNLFGEVSVIGIVQTIYKLQSVSWLQCMRGSYPL